MPTSIIRSPLMGNARVRLSGPAAEGVGPSPAQDKSSELEAQLRAHLQREYEAKLRAISEEARREGFERGREEGLVAGRTEGIQAGKGLWSDQMAKLAHIIDTAESSIREHWAHTTEAVEQLTFRAVCLLLGEHALQAEVIAGMVRQLTARLANGDILGIRLHPTECAQLKQAVSAGEQPVQIQARRLADRLVADPSLEMGGCVVETPRGDYHGTLDIQLKRLHQALKEGRLAATRHDSAIGDGAARA